MCNPQLNSHMFHPVWWMISHFLIGRMDAQSLNEAKNLEGLGLFFIILFFSRSLVYHPLGRECGQTSLMRSV